MTEIYAKGNRNFIEFYCTLWRYHEQNANEIPKTLRRNKQTKK